MPFPMPDNDDARFGLDQSEDECGSGESQMCAAHATETRQLIAKTPVGTLTSAMRLCGPCARLFDETHCRHDEPIGYCSTCGEAADEHAQEQFYGGSGSVTIDEQCAEAWQQKKGLR